jgi:hypothetical protein
MLDVGALAAFVDAFRVSIELSASNPADGSVHWSTVDWETSISRALLQLKPDAFEPLEEDSLPLHEQTEEQILRPYPSVRCLAYFSMFQRHNSHHFTAVAFLLCLQCCRCGQCAH